MPRLEGPQTNACQKWACRIQACLKDANYDSRACAWEVRRLGCRCRGPSCVHSNCLGVAQAPWASRLLPLLEALLTKCACANRAQCCVLPLPAQVNALRECCRKFGKNSTHCTRAWQPEEEGRLA